MDNQGLSLCQWWEWGFRSVGAALACFFFGFVRAKTKAVRYQRATPWQDKISFPGLGMKFWILAWPWEFEICRSAGVLFEGFLIMDYKPSLANYRTWHHVALFSVTDPLTQHGAWIQSWTTCSPAIQAGIWRRVVFSKIAKMTVKDPVRAEPNNFLFLRRDDLQGINLGSERGIHRCKLPQKKILLTCTRKTLQVSSQRLGSYKSAENFGKVWLCMGLTKEHQVGLSLQNRGSAPELSTDVKDMRH